MSQGRTLLFVEFLFGFIMLGMVIIGAIVFGPWVEEHYFPVLSSVRMADAKLVGDRLIFRFYLTKDRNCSLLQMAWFRVDKEGIYTAVPVKQYDTDTLMRRPTGPNVSTWLEIVDKQPGNYVATLNYSCHAWWTTEQTIGPLTIVPPQF